MGKMVDILMRKEVAEVYIFRNRRIYNSFYFLGLTWAVISQFY